jgi:tight adherence protein C
VVLVFAVCLFCIVALGTSLLAWRFLDWRHRAVDRLVEGRGQKIRLGWSPLLIWRELLGRIGSLLPASPKNLPRLKKRLVRAGYRHPGAPRFFTGCRAVAVCVLGVTAFAVGIHSAVPLDKLLLQTGAAAMVGYIAPNQYLSLRMSRRQHAIEKGLPNALDLMVVCVESGLGIDQTTIQVAKELQYAHPEICDEFSVMNLELRAGKRRHEALHNLADRTGVDDLKKLVAVLVQTDRFGTSIAQSLRGHAEYLRTMARQRAEERAAKLAVKLVFPIFFCILPALFVVTVGPVLTRLIRDLFPMIENM